MRRLAPIVPGQWVLERAQAFDSDVGSSWSKETYGDLAEKTVVLCYVAALCGNFCMIYAPDDAAPLKMTNENVRRRRMSRITELKTVEEMSYETRRMNKIEAPKSLDMLPFPNPRALDRSRIMDCIQSILRSRKNQQKPTDCRDTHVSMFTWEQLQQEQFKGSLSNIKVIYPLRECFDSNYMHSYDNTDGIQHAQILKYHNADELKRLGDWLGQSNFNMHRRCRRPKFCRPERVFYDSMNVVHPKFPRTGIVLKWNAATWALKVTVSYQQTPPVPPDMEHHFLPHGDCDPPPLPASYLNGDAQKQQADADEFTDAVLQDEQVEIGLVNKWSIMSQDDACANFHRNGGPPVYFFYHDTESFPEFANLPRIHHISE